MGDKVTMRWTDLRGKETSRVVNQTLDIRDYIGTAGYPLLLLAANPHLSVDVLLLWVRALGISRLERSRTWFQRRRWLFRKPGEVGNPGMQPNADRKDTRALEIMADNPEMSARDLSRLLASKGILRSREWVRRWRCAATHNSP
jgi:hypothetical protein